MLSLYFHKEINYQMMFKETYDKFVQQDLTWQQMQFKANQNLKGMIGIFACFLGKRCVFL